MSPILDYDDFLLASSTLDKKKEVIAQCLLHTFTAQVYYSSLLSCGYC